MSDPRFTVQTEFFVETSSHRNFPFKVVTISEFNLLIKILKEMILIQLLLQKVFSKRESFFYFLNTAEDNLSSFVIFYKIYEYYSFISSSRC